jgi:hypothetical protein|eukprot:CAMPEP_0174281462 /NCGR_PEP_ID=MMETSP0809-20121228/1863_1 /TAXON_ID=73025 ORGANISM="Eutreptiella gymnastica-like, Strain CCMP1594" /NCGR_SAMPLE_ID=MMETSP0809 /ASSEMBLY_ACC=CAM_ASM_000658 /LENGTH=65 /DNA_ID=CAMNT_0015375051 /DNA_START=20 /DNA_END=217 /DNA_ORIENTATION=-
MSAAGGSSFFFHFNWGTVAASFGGQQVEEKSFRRKNVFWKWMNKSTKENRKWDPEVFFKISQSLN